MTNNRLNIIDVINDFARKLMIISEKLPPEFYFSLGLSDELLLLYKEEMTKQFTNASIIYMHGQPVKELTYEHVYTPTTGHLIIKEFNKKT